MRILAIETSCDDTCAAVLQDTRVLSNVVSSQTDLHKEWGGVVPDIAKRAHQSRIKAVIATALIRSKITNSKAQIPNKSKITNNKLEQIEKRIEEGIKNIDVIAVTKGPGLAIALSVGVNFAKELAIKYNKKLVAVNHVEGHILANWAQNKKGLPKREIELPAIALTVSGGHTKLVEVSNPSALRAAPLDRGASVGKFEYEVVGEKLDDAAARLSKPASVDFQPGFKYEVIGETLDDAAGEALDKAAKLLGLGYPGGPVIERIARLHQDSGEVNPKRPIFDLPHPLADKKIMDYSFSGLKTSFYYKIKDWPEEEVSKNLANLAATFQNAVFETLIRKFKLAAEKYQPKSLIASGGVLANMELRKRLRKMARELKLPIYMPSKKILNTDNAAMIGVVGYFMALRNEWADPKTLDRDPRLEFKQD